MQLGTRLAQQWPVLGRRILGLLEASAFNVADLASGLILERIVHGAAGQVVDHFAPQGVEILWPLSGESFVKIAHASPVLVQVNKWDVMFGAVGQ